MIYNRSIFVFYYLGWHTSDNHIAWHILSNYCASSTQNRTSNFHSRRNLNACSRPTAKADLYRSGTTSGKPVATILNLMVISGNDGFRTEHHFIRNSHAAYTLDPYTIGKINIVTDRHVSRIYNHNRGSQLKIAASAFKARSNQPAPEPHNWLPIWKDPCKTHHTIKP